MKARDVVGRRIVAVRQERTATQWSGNKQLDSVWAVTGFELDNGAVLVLHPLETEYGPIVTASVVRPGRRP